MPNISVFKGPVELFQGNVDFAPRIGEMLTYNSDEPAQLIIGITNQVHINRLQISVACDRVVTLAKGLTFTLRGPKVVNWEGIKDDVTGEPITFSDEAKKKLFEDVPYLYRAILEHK